jgi:allantoicase
MNAPSESSAAFTGLVDLASEQLGGKALVATDEFFAAKENLLKPGPASFDPDRYTDLGKWMDGWESRRKRTPGHDSVIVRLGLPGVIHGVDVDTSYFLGNHPPYASLGAAALDDDGAAHLDAPGWRELLPRSALAPGSHNLFPVRDGGRWTHVRLNIFPDGGVARLRIYGEVAPDWKRIATDAVIDLASVVSGGWVAAASDMFFGSKENLIMPHVAESMRDGWETRRRRGPGHDWAIVRLGRAGRIQRLEVDTKHFKGNFPDQCSVEACHAPDARIDALNWGDATWRPLLPKTRLAAHTNHVFARELLDVGPCTHLMLAIYPDGGVSRLRAFGTIA